MSGHFHTTGFMAEPGDSRSREQQVYVLYYFMTILK